MRALIANALELVALLVLVARERVLAADTSTPTPRREVSSGPVVEAYKSGALTQPCVQCGAYQSDGICHPCFTHIWCNGRGAEA